MNLPEKYIPLTDAQLKKLAKDVVVGNVFTSAMISPENMKFLDKIFMPLSFITKDQLEWFKKHDIGIFYEYYDFTIPKMGINGCPIFKSVRSLNNEQSKQLTAYCEEFSKIANNWIGEGEEGKEEIEEENGGEVEEEKRGEALDE